MQVAKKLRRNQRAKDEQGRELQELAATTSQPQEEFIEQKARPSEDVSEVAAAAPPKGSNEK